MDRLGDSRAASWVTAGGLALALSWGCGGETSAQAGADDGGAMPVGRLAASMQLPAGMVASTMTYTLLGPASFARRVSSPLDGTNEVSFAVEGVPQASESYALSVQVTSPDGLESCTSSAQFSISEMETTTLVLIPHCNTLSSASPSAELGTLAATIELPAGIAITSLDTTLTGPAGYTLHESWEVANDSAVLVALPDVPAGAGETLAVEAISADGTEVCSGTSTFEVMASETTKTLLVLACQASASPPG